jgi:hypothetical protein
MRQPVLSALRLLHSTTGYRYLAVTFLSYTATIGE